MAVYDYRCRACGTTFEVTRSVTAPEQPVACPDGHPDVARLWSAVGITGGAPAPAASGGCCGGGCCGG